MVKVGITIDNIIRNSLPKLINVYEHLSNTDIVKDVDDINPYNLKESFPDFEITTTVSNFDVNKTDFDELDTLTSNEKYNVDDIIYDKFPFEILGAGYEKSKNILQNLKVLEKKLNVEFVFICVEKTYKSKSATLFFLSKLNFDFNNIIFIKKNNDVWNYVDILLTDLPPLIKTKTFKRYVIKIKNKFNNGIKCRYSINDLFDPNLQTIIKTIKTRIKNG